MQQVDSEKQATERHPPSLMNLFIQIHPCTGGHVVVSQRKAGEECHKQLPKQEVQRVLLHLKQTAWMKLQVYIYLNTKIKGGRDTCPLRGWIIIIDIIALLLAVVGMNGSDSNTDGMAGLEVEDELWLYDDNKMVSRCRFSLFFLPRKENELRSF